MTVMKPLSLFRLITGYSILFAMASLMMFACQQRVKEEPSSSDGLQALSGIYTNEQAVEAEATYSRACASCHGKDARGTEGGSPLLGSLEK